MKKEIESYGIPGEGNTLKISIITVLLIIFAWYLCTKYGIVKPLFLPSPKTIFDKFVALAFLGEEYAEGTLWSHTAISLYRVGIALFIGLITAIPTGLLMGVNRHFRGTLDPPIEFYRAIPPLAYIPLTVLWFGIDDFQKILVIYLAIFAPLVINTKSGVKSISVEQIHAAYSLGATKFQVLTQIILKGALPEIVTGVRIAIGFGWTTLVAAELVAARTGLGQMILNASDFLATDVVILGIVVIGIIAYSLDILIRYLEKVFIPWRGKI
jgi:taurine transport system permease protein